MGAGLGAATAVDMVVSYSLLDRLLFACRRLPAVAKAATRDLKLFLGYVDQDTLLGFEASIVQRWRSRGTTRTSEGGRRRTGQRAAGRQNDEPRLVKAAITLSVCSDSDKQKRCTDVGGGRKRTGAEGRPDRR